MTVKIINSSNNKKVFYDLINDLCILRFHIPAFKSFIAYWALICCFYFLNLNKKMIWPSQKNFFLVMNIMSRILAIELNLYWT